MTEETEADEVEFCRKCGWEILKYGKSQGFGIDSYLGDAHLGCPDNHRAKNEERQRKPDWGKQ